MNKLDRRSFLKATLMTGASVSLLPPLGRTASTGGPGVQSLARGAN